jgi:replication factor A1
MQIILSEHQKRSGLYFIFSLIYPNIYFVNQVYLFSNGSVKYADLNQLTSIESQFEIVFNVHALIIPAVDDLTIKKQHVKVVKVDRISDLVEGTVIDVIGVVRTVSGVVSIKSTKNGKDLLKREIVLVDDTFTDIKVTLWDELATSFNSRIEEHPILLVQCVQVKTFGGRALTSTLNSIITEDPLIDEANDLKPVREKILEGMLPAIHSLTLAG